MVGHGWEDVFDRNIINSKLTFQEGLEEYYELDRIEMIWNDKEWYLEYDLDIGEEDVIYFRRK